MIAAVVNHLVQSTLFALLMGLLTLGFRTNGAHVRFWLWFAASVKFLLPFSLLVAFGGHLHWDKAPAIAFGASWVSAIISAGVQHSGSLAAPILTSPAGLAPVGSGVELSSVLLLIWAAGVLFFLCKWTVYWLRLREALKASVPAVIAAPIPVRLSTALYEPGLVGIVRPVLLLPAGIIGQLSPAQLDLVISHEVCHWRRRDNLTAAIHMAAVLIFWFHPLLWWIGTRLVAEREQACDESVIAAGNDPKSYAVSILEVCRFYVRSPLTCASGIAGASLGRRVERIMINRIPSRTNTAKKALLSAAAVGLFVVPLGIGMLTPNNAAQAQAVPVVPNLGQTEQSSTTPSAGTEESIRRFIEAEQMGQPNYDEMTMPVAAENRREQPGNDLRMQGLGVLQSLSFKGKNAAGNDVYDAAFEKGNAEFTIAPLTADGKVAFRNWRILPTAEAQAAIEARIAAGQPDPERQQLLTRLLVEGQQNGGIVPGIMSSALLAAAKAQATQNSELNQRLGAFVSLQFLHVDMQGWDVYDATYQNGHVIWSVGPLTADHKLNGVLGR